MVSQSLPTQGTEGMATDLDHKLPQSIPKDILVRSARVPGSKRNAPKSPLPFLPHLLLTQILHPLFPPLTDAHNLHLRLLVHLPLNPLKHARHVLSDPLVALDAIPSLDPCRHTHASLPRQCIPALQRHRSPKLSVPEQLAQIGHHNRNVVPLCFCCVDEIDHAAGGEGDSADGPVGEDAEVLVALAQVQDDAFRGGHVGGCEDGDVRIGGTG